MGIFEDLEKSLKQAINYDDKFKSKSLSFNSIINFEMQILPNKKIGIYLNKITFRKYYRYYLSIWTHKRLLETSEDENEWNVNKKWVSFKI